MRNQPANIQPANRLSERQLVALILGGDARAFAGLIHDTERLVAQIVWKLIPGEEDRKDIVQDIYLKAFHHLGRFKFQSKLSTWIGQIAYNTCLSWLEKKKLVVAMAPAEEADDAPWSGRSADLLPADGQLLKKELAVILQTEIGGLPALYQTLIGLFHQEELSYGEMAQITSLPEGTVKSYLFRARKMLKENLLSKYKKEAL